MVHCDAIERDTPTTTGGFMRRAFEMMAAYNDWANRRLYHACAQLDGEDLRAGLGAFFGSLHASLNHMLLADRIWLARLTEQVPPDLALDAILHEGFGELRQAREAEDKTLIAYVDGLDEAALTREITYAGISNPAKIRQPRWSALMHVFNHQTHHRGQCHAMLTRVAMEAPSFDLIAFQRETGMGLNS
jgi:uncharacterized damage-inducible protein DinB